MSDVVRIFHPEPQAQLRLLCFAHAGGDISLFRRWGQRLAPEIEILAVKLPARGELENRAMPKDWPALLDYLSSGLPKSFTGAFACFGHSMGGLIAYEWLSHRQSQGLSLPRRLIISASMPPHLALGREIDYHLLSDDELIAKIQAWGTLPPVLLEHRDFLKLLLGSVRADFDLLSRYRPLTAQPLDCPLSAWGGERDTMVTPAELAPWSRYTARDFSLKLFPGGHFYFLEDSQGFFEALKQELLV